jgi:hypothetical protein
MPSAGIARKSPEGEGKATGLFHKTLVISNKEINRRRQSGAIFMLRNRMIVKEFLNTEALPTDLPSRPAN